MALGSSRRRMRACRSHELDAPSQRRAGGTGYKATTGMLTEAEERAEDEVRQVEAMVTLGARKPLAGLEQQQADDGGAAAAQEEPQQPRARSVRRGTRKRKGMKRGRTKRRVSLADLLEAGKTGDLSEAQRSERAARIIKERAARRKAKKKRRRSSVSMDGFVEGAAAEAAAAQAAQAVAAPAEREAARH